MRRRVHVLTNTLLVDVLCVCVASATLHSLAYVTHVHVLLYNITIYCTMSSSFYDGAIYQEKKSTSKQLVRKRLRSTLRRWRNRSFRSQQRRKNALVGYPRSQRRRRQLPCGSRNICRPPLNWCVTIITDGGGSFSKQS